MFVARETGEKSSFDMKPARILERTRTLQARIPARTLEWGGGPASRREERTCVRGGRRSEYETRKHASRARKAPILVAQLRRRGYGDG